MFVLALNVTTWISKSKRMDALERREESSALTLKEEH